MSVGKRFRRKILRAARYAIGMIKKSRKRDVRLC